MKKNINIKQIKGKTFVYSEVSKEDLNTFTNLIPEIETLGMSKEKVEDQKRQVDEIIGDMKNVAALVAFVNVNGMSTKMVSEKYDKEINIIKALRNANLKQSFLRLYVLEFRLVNEIQTKNDRMNFYMRKATRFELNPIIYQKMHFSYQFDETLFEIEDFKSLKNKIVNK